MELRVLETHVSSLIFTDEYVYKIKKPVSFDFVDLTSLDARVQACHAEVDLNRRLAPDVYVGVGTFEDPRGPVEPVVVMHRLPEEHALSSLVLRRDPDVTSGVDAVAAVLARFHRTATRSDAIDAACTAPAVKRLWRHNADGLREVAGAILSRDDLDLADRLAGEYLAARDPVFDRRIHNHRAVDGHGDLLADDIFYSGHSVNILDCLEFDPELRYVDGLLDVASLATDLERYGRPDLARRLLAAYRDASGDDWPESLAHFYMAYRALVRAKVACIRAATSADSSSGDETEARCLLALALEHLDAGRMRLVLIGGVPGTGKTTLAHRAAEVTGWAVLSSDDTRRRLLRRGSPISTDPADYQAGPYSRHITDRVYAQLLREADAIIREGRSVIVDASWSLGHLRHAAKVTAARVEATLGQVQCTVPREVAERRIAARRAEEEGGSEATPAIADAMAERFEPWTGSAAIDTSGDVDDTVIDILGALEWSGSRQPSTAGRGADSGDHPRRSPPPRLIPLDFAHRVGHPAGRARTEAGEPSV